MSRRIKCCSLNTDQGPHVPVLQAAGFEVIPCNRAANWWRPEELIAELQGCCAVVAGSEPYTREVLGALPDLRVIARTGVGFDAVDMAACTELGIVVATTPGVNHHAVAEHVIALLMAQARGIVTQDHSVRTGQWRRDETPRVMGRTLGLIGLGRIGQAVATRAVGLGLRVLVHEPNPAAEFLQHCPCTLVDLPTLLAESDFVSLHCPLLPATRNLMNAETLAAMKRSAVLINTARGGLVDETALISALRDGVIAGAALDVFEVEPLPLTSPLMQLPNVVLSGHVAGLDAESQRDTLLMSAGTIIALFQGASPPGCLQNFRDPGCWTWRRDPGGVYAGGNGQASST